MNHLWKAAYVLFWLSVYFSISMGVVWTIGCLIGSWVASKQRKRHPSRKARDHRVGGAYNP